MNMESLISVQEMFPYFDMLNGPTYVTLVKDFWARAEVYDLEAALTEEDDTVIRNPTLRGKSREEMGLKSFKQTEIRSSVMGIPIIITEEVIAKACRVSANGRFIWNANRTHPFLESYKGVVLKGNTSTKLVDIEGQHRMLLKFMTECFFQKGGGSDEPSNDHKLVLYFLASFNKINLPRYIMHHLCWAIKEGIRSKRKQIPCGRLLSEIFTQGKILEILKNNNLASDQILRTKTGKMINGKTLQNMKIIKKFSPNEKDLKESTAPTKLMTDFPPIYQERNSEALAKLVVEYAKDSSIRMDTDVPAAAATEAPLQVRRKRTASDDGSRASGAQTKKSRKDKSEASATVNSSAPIPKRKRGKGESSIIKDAASEADAMKWDEEVEERSAKKKQSSDTQYESPMFVVTPAMARMAKEHTHKLLADKKQKEAEYLAERDAKLQSLGLENFDEYFVQKLVEVRQIAGSVEQQVVVEAAEILELIPEASIAAPESTVVAEVLETLFQVTQTSNLPLIIPTPVSLSNDSDLDDVPIGQRMRKLSKPSPQPKQTTPQLPFQAEQSSAAAECTEDPEDPPASDLPQCDSPSNLFSLERHLGGEITKTPEKATKSVPQKIELVNQPEPVAETAVYESVQVIDSEQTVIVTESEPNQQQPEQPHQSSPNQTTISTPTLNQPENQHSPQKAIPEPVVETVVSESVQVTKSEQTVAITVSEPIQPTTHPSSITIINDQPSSSSSTIQTLQPPPPPNILKFEFLDAELLAITSEVQRLVEQRRSPTLHLDYQEQWDSLQTRASNLLSFLSQKCNKIHEVAAMHYATLVHFVEDQDPLLLANTPFFPASEYFSRERRLLKQYRQSALKHHVEYKAREDELLQKQLALDAALKEKDALIARLMNQQPQP